MASISIGPGGTNIQGDHACTNNNFLGDQGNPLGAVIETVNEQRMTGIVKMRYPDMAVALDRHMPMRETTGTRVDGNMTYRTSVGYQGLLNSAGVKDITPSTAAYNNPVQILDACGNVTTKNIASRANTNAQACNPAIDGPLPIVGREQYGRQAFETSLPIPPMCMADYPNKENFLTLLSATLDSVNNAALARWTADKMRWLIGKGRFNATPFQISQGSGKAKLPVSEELFAASTFGRLPTHYGSASWMAGMLRFSDIDPRLNLRVDLPVSIFRKYKEQLIQEIGINIYQGAETLTKAINGFITSIQGETLIYQDQVYGRKITFYATTEPIYVEVEETNTGGGQWEFQEPWIFRNSETAGQVMTKHNPIWGVACSCANRTLAAIVMVSAEDARPFYTEPLPNNNPAAGINALIDKFAAGAGSKLNTTLRQMYPSTLETTIYTGVEAQVYMLDPLNRRYRDAGANCDIANNNYNTWIAGFTRIAAQFVENDPRALVNFLLRVPAEDDCVDLVVACGEAPAIPENLAFDPNLRETVKQVVEVPDPEPAPVPEAGEAYVIGKSTTVVAPCADTKEVSVLFRRKGGTLGAISVTVPGPPSAHGGTVPGTVEFADGETEASLTWDIPAWVCTTPTQTTETFVLTFSGADYASDGIATRRICIKCNPACPAECEGDVGGCPSC